MVVIRERDEEIWVEEKEGGLKGVEPEKMMVG